MEVDRIQFFISLNRLYLAGSEKRETLPGKLSLGMRRLEMVPSCQELTDWILDS